MCSAIFLQCGICRIAFLNQFLMHRCRERESQEKENVCAMTRDRVSIVCREEDSVANGMDCHVETMQPQFFVYPGA